ncbi:hypothetical protein SDC9_189943 [bioreactor metagenome]|uniref:Uncharacterized protein n=1 Tax=bioreactor metagenome TaxID=1076179 RepID=A0A645HUY2_9ZZZZ
MGGRIRGRGRRHGNGFVFVHTDGIRLVYRSGKHVGRAGGAHILRAEILEFVVDLGIRVPLPLQLGLLLVNLIQLGLLGGHQVFHQRIRIHSGIQPGDPRGGIRTDRING